jgi:predicted DNA-binding protein (MmcQ/YjbR family)
MKAVAERLKTFALSFPETEEAHPWGETAIKVKGKVFVFMHIGDARLSLSVKLPHSREFALDRDFTEPTHYGLGAKGWVSAKFEGKGTGKPGKKSGPPVELLEAWIEESYRAIAPKRVLAKLDKT